MTAGSPGGLGVNSSGGNYFSQTFFHYNLKYLTLYPAIIFSTFCYYISEAFYINTVCQITFKFIRYWNEKLPDCTFVPKV